MSLPKTTEVIAIQQQGGLEVLEKKTLPFPEQGPKDIVVKVRVDYFHMMHSLTPTIAPGGMGWGQHDRHLFPVRRRAPKSLA
jgi:hypothetical protein